MRAYRIRPLSAKPFMVDDAYSCVRTREEDARRGPEHTRDERRARKDAIVERI